VKAAVIDASVLTAFYCTPDATATVSARLAGGDSFYAPAHFDVEIVSAMRRLAKTHSTVDALTPAALAHLAAFPLRRMPLAPLLQRIWQLRDNLTPYDAAYVALAEKLGTPVVTFDARLTRAAGTRCSFELLAAPSA
jgi:predicted nucleic acid-binding protein